MNPTSAARELFATGQIDEAVDLLERAGSDGDAVACAELATCYLRGDIVPRDVLRARQYLRKAAVIGHVDAALTEVALVANGSGSDPDWPLASSLLQTAAVNDHVAAKQWQLMSAMDIDRDGYPRLPTTGETLSTEPLVTIFRGAVTPAECLHLATVAHAHLEPATVVSPSDGRQLKHPFRTSFGAVIGPTIEDMVVGAVCRRLASLSSTRVEQGEPLSVLRYDAGQEYRPHVDTLPGAQNQRIATAIIYLNDGYQGGETEFDRNRLRVRGRAGDVLLFHNVTDRGVPDQRSRHAGLPVRAGVKWIATRWIRERPYDPWTYQEGA